MIAIVLSCIFAGAVVLALGIFTIALYKDGVEKGIVQEKKNPFYKGDKDE